MSKSPIPSEEPAITKSEAKPAIAAVNELFAKSPGGLRRCRTALRRRGERYQHRQTAGLPLHVPSCEFSDWRTPQQQHQGRGGKQPSGEELRLRFSLFWFRIGAPGKIKMRNFSRWIVNVENPLNEHFSRCPSFLPSRRRADFRECLRQDFSVSGILAGHRLHPAPLRRFIWIVDRRRLDWRSLRRCSSWNARSRSDGRGLDRGRTLLARTLRSEAQRRWLLLQAPVSTLSRCALAALRRRHPDHQRHCVSAYVGSVYGGRQHRLPLLACFGRRRQPPFQR
jgi:hypothetical protein